MAEYLNKNVKHLRTSKGISQQDLADKVGIDRSTISRIENNEIDTTVDNALKIAEVLKVTLADLLGKDLSVNSVNNELDNLLFSKAKVLTDDEKKAVLQVMDAIHKDIDKELDNK